MKKVYLGIIFTLTTLIPNILLGATKDFTINWTVSDPIDVTSVKLYYSDNIAMVDKILHTDCNALTEDPANTYTMTCGNFNITQYPVYFTISATIDGENISSPAYIIENPITIVQDFKVLTQGANITPTAMISASITEGTAPLVVNFDSNGSNDTDGSIISYSWEYGDGNNGTGITTQHTYTTPGSHNATLTVTDNQGASSQSSLVISANEPTTATFTLAVNFQGYESDPPAGFLNDWGKSFDDQATPGYGWVGILPTISRERNNPISPDKSYDTFLFIYPEYQWEAAVPNGTYKITACVGDVTYPGDTTESLQVEGISLVNQEDTTTDSRWIERDITVPVSDGRLTLTFQQDADNRTAFCWIKINSI